MATAQAVNLLLLQPGDQLQLLDGAVVEVASNPEDGMWIICRYISHPTNEKLVGVDEHPVFAHDIAGTLQQ